MMTVYRKKEAELTAIDTIEKGCWVNLVNPTEDEIRAIADMFGFELDWLRSALDEEESARIETDGDMSLIIVDIPIVDTESTSFMYTTLPLAVMLCDSAIVTVCLRETAILNDFITNRVKNFYTYKKNTFLLQILYTNATKFLQNLKQIDKTSTQIQAELTRSYKNKELIQLLDLEKSLVYFSTSLTSNEMVLHKLKRFDFIRKYEEDNDLLEDVIVENRQAIEMCTIYRDILSGTMDAFASVISNNLNIAMKLLAAITIVMAIPTLITGMWGMNLINLPFEHSPYGFWIITSAAAIISVLVAFIMHKKKMF